MGPEIRSSERAFGSEKRLIPIASKVPTLLNPHLDKFRSVRCRLVQSDWLISRLHIALEIHKTAQRQL